MIFLCSLISCGHEKSACFRRRFLVAILGKRHRQYEHITYEVKRGRVRIAPLWQRMRDSNPRKRSQSPVCYRYTNPLHLERYYYIRFSEKVKHFF